MHIKTKKKTNQNINIEIIKQYKFGFKTKHNKQKRETSFSCETKKSLA